jgi:GNAT superfamily N-acetyltransferase
MGQFGHVEQLKSCDGAAFREFYEIYAASIAHREQKPEAWICRMLAAPEYRFLVLRGEGGHVQGFSILFLPVAERFALLEYMAVSEAARNRGMGSALFQQTMAWAKASDGRDAPVLLEVDSDREACGEQQIRRRRQHFYRRLGCLRFAGLHYILPLTGEGSAPEMDLMLYAKEPLRQLPKADLERWLRTIYKGVYHCSADDARIPRMLGAVGDPVPLE